MTKTELLQEAKDLGIQAKGLARMKNEDLQVLIAEAKSTEVGVAGTLKHRILELYGQGFDKKAILSQLESAEEEVNWAAQLKCGKIRSGYIYIVIRNAK